MIQEFVHQIRENMRDSIKDIHTAIPGRIISFDAGKGLATVLPMMKFEKPDGTTIDYPHITGVPVLFPQGTNQKATVAFPVKEGDGCLIIISEKPLDYWMYGQETSTDLSFDLTNAICIPGLFSKGNSVVAEACSKNAIIVDFSGNRVTIQNDKIQMDAPKIVINADIELRGKLTATDDVIANSSVSLANHTHTGDSGGTTSKPN